MNEQLLREWSVVWMMSIEPRLHHREAIRPITVTRARYQVGYHHRLNARANIDLEKPVFYTVEYVLLVA